jgi:hypothetical protein
MTKHYPCYHTISESGHVQCPFCGCMDEAKVQNLDETMPLLNEGKLIVTVPVWTCLFCDQSWTDWVAEDLRDRALREPVE